MSHHIVQVDAFTDKPFGGNPAGVCILSSAAADDWMQKVAREMNLSETAFLHPVENGYNLRWFTPTIEVELCGHATLATAHVLFDDGHHSPDTLLRFQTRSGELTARKDGSWIELDFPATPAEETSAPPGLIEALGVSPRFVGHTTSRSSGCLCFSNHAVSRSRPGHTRRSTVSTSTADDGDRTLQ